MELDDFISSARTNQDVTIDHSTVVICFALILNVDKEAPDGM